MCIIIAKTKKGRIPTREELMNSFEYNSDGAGFMYTQGGKVIIDKGYMKLKDFLDRFDELCKEFHNFKNKSLVVHCRIGTSSGNTAANTHPYPITNKEKELHKTLFKTDLGMAHNGIIREYTPTWTTPTTNDTQEFILKYVYNLYKNWHDFYKNRFILEGLEKITNSKLAFLDKNDNLYLVGDFIEDDDLSFSNSTYKSYRTYNKSPYSTPQKINDELTLYEDDYLYDDYLYLNDYYNDKSDREYVTKQFLSSDWTFCHGETFEEVGDRDLVWDYETLELFEYTGNNTLIKRYDDVRVFDENNEEVW